MKQKSDSTDFHFVQICLKPYIRNVLVEID